MMDVLQTKARIPYSSFALLEQTTRDLGGFVQFFLFFVTDATLASCYYPNTSQSAPYKILFLTF